MNDTHGRSAHDRGVTVVIPTYNRWLLLRSAVWSALRQEGVSPHVIIVDDGSEDVTPSRLAQVEHERVTVLRIPVNSGVSAARNLGLEHVSTDWVTFLDDDDVWAPFHLAELLEAIGQATSGTEVDIAYSGSLTITGDRSIRRVRPAPAPERVPEGLLSTNVLRVPSRVLVRSEAVRAAGGFDTDLSIAADWDLWLRIARDGALAASPALSVGYTQHRGNMHLDMPRALEDLENLESRHAGARGPRDRTFLESCAPWIARGYRARGNRPRAALWYLRSFRMRQDRRDLARAAGVLLGERTIARSGLAGDPVIPQGTGAWLKAVREIDRLPADEVPFASE